MVSSELQKKTVILLKRVSKDLENSISVQKCNDYIEDLEALKDELSDAGVEWIDNYDSVDFVDDRPSILDYGNDEEDIADALQEVHDQLDRIVGTLGIDLSESAQNRLEVPIQNSPPVTINFSPTMTQNQNSSNRSEVSVNIKQELSMLETEFNREYQKMIPNKSKLDAIIEKVKQYGPTVVPLVLKLKEKLKNLGLFPF